MTALRAQDYAPVSEPFWQAQGERPERGGGLSLSLPLPNAGGISGDSENSTVSPGATGPVETGLASWYGPGFHQRKTASGERFDMYAMTAAHRTLAFGTLICVRSKVTGVGIVARVNDRGPHLKGRVVDLSRAAAMALGVHGLGIKPVEVTPLPAGRTECDDD